MKAIWDWGRHYAVAWFFVGVGGVAIALARGIQETSFQNEFDPGPRALPTLLGGCLMILGVAEGLAQARRSRKTAPEGDWKAPAALVAALAIYVLVMPWTGFVVATWVLLAAFLRWMGSAWLRAGLLAAALVAVIQALFGGLFKVPLPLGVFGLSFSS